MSARLISDATMVTALIRASECRMDPEDSDFILRAILSERLGDALDFAKREQVACCSDRLPAFAHLLVALEEANEEAAREHDRRECSAPRCSRCGGCGNGSGACAAPCGPCAVCETASAEPRAVHVGVALEDSTPRPDGLHDVTLLTSGHPWDSGKSADPIGDIKSMIAAVGPPDVMFTDLETGLKITKHVLELVRAERDEARAERDGLRVELAAARRKIQGMTIGARGRRRRS